MTRISLSRVSKQLNVTHSHSWHVQMIHAMYTYRDHSPICIQGDPGALATKKLLCMCVYCDLCMCLCVRLRVKESI